MGFKELIKMKKIVLSAAVTAVFSLVAFSFIGSQQDILETTQLSRALESSQGVASAISNTPIQVSSSKKCKTLNTVGVQSLTADSAESKSNPIEAFQRWANGFMADSGSELEGIRLAKIRRSEMAELIKNNPEKAIANKIDNDIREFLPRKIRAELEQSVHGRGQFESQTISRYVKSDHIAEVAAQYRGLDPRLVGKNPSQYKLVQHNSQKITHNGETYKVHTYGKLRGLASQENMLFNGIALDGHLAMNESPVRLMGKTSKGNALAAGQVELESLDPVTGETVNLAKGGFIAEADGNYYALSRKENAAKLGYRLMGAEAGVSPGPGRSDDIKKWNNVATQGNKNVLIIRPNFADDLAEPPSIAEIEGAMKEVNDFFVESSYSTLSFTSTVTPTLTLPKSKLWYEQKGQTMIKDSAIEQAQINGYIISNYDLIMIAIDELPGPAFEGWVVVSFGEGLFIKGGYVEAICRNLSSLLLGNTLTADYWNTVAPEKIEPDPEAEDPPIPHSLSDVMGRDSVYGPGIVTYEQDMWSLMGGGNRQFNAPAKHSLGWLPSSSIADISESKTIRLFAYDVPKLTRDGRHALRIVKDENVTYWLQYRVSNQRSRWSPGGESFLDSLGEEKLISPMQDHWSKNGLQLIWEDGFSLSKLLDASPGSAGLDMDSPLMVGRTFVEQSIGLYVTPIAQSEPEEEVPWIDVVVNMGAFADNNSPKLDITASETSVDDGDEITFNANALDPDGDAMGIYWDFGDGNYAYSQMEVNHAFEDNGEYLVRCEVSDMKGGHTSRYIVVTVGSPGTLRISGKVISEIGLPVENVQVAAQEAVAGDFEAELIDPVLRSFTDEEGNFVIVGVEADKSYALNANLYGYLTSPVGFSIPFEVNDMDAADLLFLAAEIPKINIYASVSETVERQ